MKSKYGKEAFTREILGEYVNEQDAYSAEIDFIKEVGLFTILIKKLIEQGLNKNQIAQTMKTSWGTIDQRLSFSFKNGQ